MAKKRVYNPGNQVYYTSTASSTKSATSMYYDSILGYEKKRAAAAEKKLREKQTQLALDKEKYDQRTGDADVHIRHLMLDYDITQEEADQVCIFLKMPTNALPHDMRRWVNDVRTRYAISGLDLETLTLRERAIIQYLYRDHVFFNGFVPGEGTVAPKDPSPANWGRGMMAEMIPSPGDYFRGFPPSMTGGERHSSISFGGGDFVQDVGDELILWDESAFFGPFDTDLFFREERGGGDTISSVTEDDLLPWLDIVLGEGEDNEQG